MYFHGTHHLPFFNLGAVYGMKKCEIISTLISIDISSPKKKIEWVILLEQPGFISGLPFSVRHTGLITGLEHASFVLQ
jgi:hypothetical protein